MTDAKYSSPKVLPETVGPVRAPHGLAAAIFALALGGLFIGTGEFASMSLLPNMAESTQVSVPTAGAYISAYAVGVLVGAPIIAVACTRWSRKVLLITLLVLIFGGYLTSAFASSYILLLLARCLAGVPHGAFFGVASLAAAAMVPKNKRAQATGWVMLGLATANVMGVPAATWLGQSFGWRVAFIMIGVGCVVTAVLVWIFVPRIAAEPGTGIRTELSAFSQGQVWLTLSVAAVGFGGMFAVYSYITSTLTHVTKLSEDTVPLVLVVWGLGMVVGNLVGGWLADMKLTPAIIGMLVWNVIMLGMFSVTASVPVLVICTLFLIGCGFSLVPALQTRLMNVAGKAQTLAAALNHSAFNAANAIGASLGGASIAAGYGWASTGWVGALLALSGLCIMMITLLLRKR